MFDEDLAARIRVHLRRRRDVGERKMFGGIAFMIGDHMCIGIIGSDLMVRVGPDAFEQALALPYARPMDFTGRPSRGMVYVAPPGLRTAKSLGAWIDRGLDFVKSLPEKKTTTRRTTARPTTARRRKKHGVRR